MSRTTAGEGNRGNGHSVRLGTRSSPLARWQAEWVADRLRSQHAGLEVELVEIATHGDRDRNSPLAAIGGMGLFTKEIQRALLDERVDLAVHSLKDLPTQEPPGLTLGAVPERESPFDALITHSAGRFSELREGARVATGSLRRRAFLKYARPDLELVEIRGNVETRLRHATEGRVDAVVLAEAGLKRLGVEAHITEVLSPPQFLPAPGQGALGIECRASDQHVRELLAALDCPATHAAVAAERALLAVLEGGCMVPVGALGAVVRSGELHLSACVLNSTGTRRLDADDFTTAAAGDLSAATALGARVAQRLITQGAMALIHPDSP